MLLGTEWNRNNLWGGGGGNPSIWSKAWKEIRLNGDLWARSKARWMCLPKRGRYISIWIWWEREWRLIFNFWSVDLYLHWRFFFFFNCDLQTLKCSKLKGTYSSVGANMWQLIDWISSAHKNLDKHKKNFDQIMLKLLKNKD